MIGVEHVDAEYIRSYPYHPLSIPRDKLNPCQAFTVPQIGRLAFLGFQSNFDDSLFSWLTCIFIAKFGLELAGNSGVPILFRWETKFTKCLFYGRIFVTTVLMHDSSSELLMLKAPYILEPTLLQNGRQVRLSHIILKGAVTKNHRDVALGFELLVPLGNTEG